MTFFRKTIDDALIDSRYYQYSRYRLSYFLVTNFFFLIIEIIEFLLLRKAIPADTIIQVIILRILSSFLLKGWWGALELLREGVRSKMSFGYRSGSNQLILNWSILGFIFSIILCILASIWFFFADTTGFTAEQKTVYNWYVVSLYAQIFLSTILATYNAGIYSILRVYRPITYMIGVAIFNFVLLILLWNTIGVIGLPLAFLIGTVVQNVVRFIFIRETYERLALNPIDWPNWEKFKRFIQEFPFKLFINAFLAGTTLELEFVLVLFFFQETSLTSTALVYLFIQRQIFQSLVQWRFLFYYDIRKARYGYFPLFYNRFMHKLGITSFVVTLFCYGVGQSIGYFFYPTEYWNYALLLALFFFPLSYVAFIQIEAFCHNRYTDLIISALATIALLFGVDYFSNGNLTYEKWGTLFVILGLLVFLLKTRFPYTVGVDTIKKQSLYAIDWFRHRFSGQLNLYILTLFPNYSKIINEKLMSEVSNLIDPSSLIVLLRSNQILIVEPSKASKLTDQMIIKLSAGTLEKSHAKRGVSWYEVIDEIRKEIFSNISRNSFYKKLGNNPTQEQVKKLFFHKFPHGIVTDVGKEEHLLPQLLSFSHGSLVYRSVQAFFNSFPVDDHESRVYMAAFCFFDHDPILFVQRKKAHENAFFREWQIYMHYLNWSSIPDRVGRDNMT